MIEITRDPDDLAEFTTEHCCFCRRPTRYWFAPKDVAVCRACAPHAEAKDVPTKKMWCRHEDIAKASRRPPKPKHKQKESKKKSRRSSGRQSTTLPT